MWVQFDLMRIDSMQFDLLRFLKNESQKTIDMITKIDTGIPINTNNRILDNLYATKNWYFGFDENNFMNKDQKDAGFLIVTYKENQDYYNNDILNTSNNFYMCIYIYVERERILFYIGYEA